MAYDFSEYAVSAETTKEYVFAFIPGEPSIICSPADDSNIDYRREDYRLSMERNEKAAQTQRAPIVKDTVDDLIEREDEALAARRVMLARTCCRSWGKAPLDVNGKANPFSEQECLDFLTAIPDWMFRAFSNWVGNIFNFAKRPPITEAEATRLGNE